MLEIRQAGGEEEEGEGKKKKISRDLVLGRFQRSTSERRQHGRSVPEPSQDRIGFTRLGVTPLLTLYVILMSVTAERYMWPQFSGAPRQK